MRVEVPIRVNFSNMFRVTLVLGLAILSSAAPKSRSRSPQLVYDQKQKGDYNIQVHLKNFQVIALLGDDGTGGFGDYDYNYDYGDFTVKPSGSTPSKAPLEISVTTVKPVGESQSTAKDAEKSTIAPDSIIDDNQKPSSEKPLELLGEKKPLENTSDNLRPSTIKEDLIPTNTPKVDKKYSELEASDAIPGQIQVQVLQSPEEYANFGLKKASESVGIDSAGRTNEKRCSSGFSKDKKGRCRRLRRPQSTIPFDFGSLAHLAARFRSAATDGSTNVKLSASGPEKH